MSKTKAQRDIEDCEFILSEIVRLNSMEFKDLMAYLDEHKNDSWFDVPHPSGSGGLVCGEAAGRRFYDLTSRHLATQASLRNNFDPEDFTSIVRGEFSFRFLKQGTEVNQRNIDKMLSAAVKKAKANHKALTHYIPCVVVSSAEPEAFRIGPVVFVRMEKFVREHREAFEAERERIQLDHIRRCEEAIEKGSPTEQIATPDISAGIANRLVDDTVSYFEKFKWMAVVDIPECDVAISRKRAETTVEAALDILKLFFKRVHGESLRQGHAYAPPPNTASLAREAGGKFNFSLAWSSQDAPAGKNWIRILTEPDDSYARAAASALDSCVDPQHSSHLKERFLDAMSWYGQAISELMASLQIVKYVAALERLTVTRKMDEGLTEAVTTRAALLNYDGTGEDYDRVLREAQKVYDYRSGLMHGSLSPFDSELESVSPSAEDIARQALFSCLALFTRLDSQTKDAGRKDLEAEYQKLYEQIPQRARAAEESKE